MKQPFEYFTNDNPHKIYIEDRGSRVGRYAVWHNNSIVDDCLNKAQALSLANLVLKDQNQNKEDRP